MVRFLVTLWDNFGSIGVVWFFCGMSISKFWLNLVHEVGLFGFWKLMRLGFFLFGLIDSKEAWNHLCILLKEF